MAFCVPFKGFSVALDTVDLHSLFFCISTSSVKLYLLSSPFWLPLSSSSPSSASQILSLTPFFLPSIPPPLWQFHPLLRLQLAFYMINHQICISRCNLSPLLQSSVPKGLLGIFIVIQVRIFTVIFPSSCLHPTFNHPLVLFLYPLSSLLLLPTILHTPYLKSQTLIALLLW